MTGIIDRIQEGYYTFWTNNHKMPKTIYLGQEEYRALKKAAVELVMLRTYKTEIKETETVVLGMLVYVVTDKNHFAIY